MTFEGLTPGFGFYILGSALKDIRKVRTTGSGKPLHAVSPVKAGGKGDSPNMIQTAGL